MNAIFRSVLSLYFLFCFLYSSDPYQWAYAQNESVSVAEYAGIEHSHMLSHIPFLRSLLSIVARNSSIKYDDTAERAIFDDSITVKQNKNAKDYQKKTNTGKDADSKDIAGNINNSEIHVSIVNHTSDYLSRSTINNNTKENTASSTILYQTSQPSLSHNASYLLNRDGHNNTINEIRELNSSNAIHPLPLPVSHDNISSFIVPHKQVQSSSVAQTDL